MNSFIETDHENASTIPEEFQGPFQDNILGESNKNSGNYNKVWIPDKPEPIVKMRAEEVPFLASCRENCDRENLPSWISDKSASIVYDRSARSLKNNIDSVNINIKKFAEHSVYAIIAIALALILNFPWFFQGADRGTACIDKGDNITLTDDICRLEIIVERYHGDLRVLTAFILGGFVTTTIYLWRLRRNNYCILCGATRGLIIQIGAILPQGNDEESFNLRQTMLRWTLLGYELAVLNGRNKMDTLEGRYHLDYLGLLEWDEWDKMTHGDRITSVLFWILSKLSQLQSQGVITGLDKQHLCNFTADLRDRANNLMSTIDRDHSIPYATIVALLVNLNLGSLTIWNGLRWAIRHYNSEGECWRTFSMYFDIISFVLYNIMFSMLFDLSQILYNPFGPRLIDIPHNEVSRQIRKLAREIAKCDLPSSMKSNNPRESEGKEVFANEPSGMILKDPNPSARRRVSLLGTLRNFTLYD